MTLALCVIVTVIWWLFTTCFDIAICRLHCCLCVLLFTVINMQPLLCVWRKKTPTWAWSESTWKSMARCSVKKGRNPSCPPTSTTTAFCLALSCTSCWDRPRYQNRGHHCPDNYPEVQPFSWKHSFFGGGGKVCGTLLLLSIILETATQDNGALPGLHLWEWAAGRLGWGRGGGGIKPVMD